MVRVVLAIAVLLLCGHSCLGHAQKRVEAGLLLDYLKAINRLEDFEYRVLIGEQSLGMTNVR